MFRPPIVPDAQIEEWIRAGLTVSQMHELTPVDLNARRLQRISRKIGIPIIQHYAHRLANEAERSIMRETLDDYHRNARAHLSITDGCVLVGSDAHYWPGIVSTAHLAFLQFCRELKPRAIVLNGDMFDGASISRYPRIGWDKRPTVKQELAVVDDRLAEVEEAAGTRALYWPLGNHDMRFEVKLAANAPEYEGVDGFTLKERFPHWKPCWGVWLNEDTVIKHRWKGGAHAGRNNTLFAGRTMVTGHDHHLDVRSLTDYNGTRWGVQTGTLADPYGPQFVDYTEDSPKDHNQGFVVLTVHRGKLLKPETVRVMDEETVDFRGHAIVIKGAST